VWVSDLGDGLAHQVEKSSGAGIGSRVAAADFFEASRPHLGKGNNGGGGRSPGQPREQRTFQPLE
jgi:hypothetical protein